MTPRDPTHQLLKAYYDLLKDSIVYAGDVVKVGTKIPQRTNTYIYLYIESLLPYNTGDSVIYKAIIAIQVVSLQEVSEGDETVVNSIIEQIIPMVDDADYILMTDFNCVMIQFEDSDHNTEMTDSNYIITKKLRMLNFIEQKR